MRYRERRYPCQFPVDLSTGGLVFSGVFTSISYHGAHAVLSQKPNRGEEVRFSMKGLPVDATVIRFAAGGGVGLKFKRPLSKLQLNSIRSSLRPGRARPTLSEMS